MNLTLVEKLLQHDDLRQLPERIQNNGQKILVTAHHDTEEIQDILERVKQDRAHHGWETLLGCHQLQQGFILTCCAQE